MADSFDVVRCRKDKVKIIDFGAMDAASTKGTLFTYEELQNHIENTPEFRFIGEEIGIQPKPPVQFCIPQEISEFLQSRDNITLLEAIQRVRLPITKEIFLQNLAICFNVAFRSDAQSRQPKFRFVAGGGKSTERA